MRKVLAILSINPDYIQFAVPELKSVLASLPFDLKTLLKDQLIIQPQHTYQINYKNLKNFPFVVLNVPNFEQHRQFFQNACKSSIMLNKLVLLISQGETYEAIFKNRNLEVLNQFCSDWEDITACDFISRNRFIGRKEQIAKINRVLGQLDVHGKIDIKNAKKRYQLVEDHIWYHEHHESPIQSTIKNIFFGIQLCTNKIGTAKFNYQYELSKRIYLGPTSADNDLAFMMCNQANIQQGSLVIDPFVGTGGLLIPPSSKGAITFGCDLDMRVINGYSVGRINKKSPYYNPEKKLQVYTPKINLSFEQYGFATPNIFRMDSTNLSFRNIQIFDAIITDPPYGLRAMSRSVNTKEKKQISPQLQKTQQQGQKIFQVDINTIQKKQEVNQKDHEDQMQQQQQKEGQLTQQQILQKKQKKQKRKERKKQRKQKMTQQQKNFKKQVVQKLNRERIDQWDKFDKHKIQCTQRQKIFQGLINFARKNLKKGGRLVFLFPVYEDQQYKGVQNLPVCEGFSVIDMSQNKLSKNNSRILVTLQKNK